MRSFSSPQQAFLAQLQGAEQTILVEIDWGDGKTFHGDRAIPGTCDGRVMNLSELRASVKAGGVGSVGSVSVALSDSDGVLLAKLATHRLDACPVRVLLLTTGASIELLAGIAASPQTWHESERVLEFDVVSPLQSRRFPYVPLPDTSTLPHFAWGKAWPYCFGTPVDVPAVMISRPPQGTLVAGILMTTTSFQIEVTNYDEFVTGQEITIDVGGEWLTVTLELTSTSPGMTIYTATIVARNVSKGIVYGRDRLTLDTGGLIDPLLSPYEVPLSITENVDPRYASWSDEVEVLAGNWMLLLDITAIFPSLAGSWSVFPYGQPTPTGYVGINNYILYQLNRTTRGQLPWWGPTGPLFIGTGFRADVRAHLPFDQWAHAAGARVLQVTDSGGARIATKYVVHNGHATDVPQVRAYKNVVVDLRGGKQRRLVTVPASYYTVNLNDTVDGQPATTISLRTPLQQRDAGWDEQIYATVISETGPNVSDIISWILTTYASATVDAASFASVKAACVKYPCNFAVLSEQDALPYAGQIAFQARCGLFTVGSTVTLVYLSARYTSGPGLVSDSNYKEASLQLSSTEQGDMINDYRVTYKERYSIDEPERIVLVNQPAVNIYGLHRNETEWFIYQKRSLVTKSVRYWLNIRSRSWRRVRLVSFPEALSIQLLDVVPLVLQNALLTDPCLGRPEDIGHDTNMGTIALDCWTPVEVGTTVESPYAWLDDSGDVTPAAITYPPGPEIVDILEVTPLDFSPVTTSTFIGQARTDESLGIFNAQLYQSNAATGVINQVDVQVANPNPTSPVKKDDIVAVAKAPDGSYFAVPAPTGTTVYFGQVGTITGRTFVSDLLTTDGTVTTIRVAGATVMLFGDNDVVTGQVVMIVQAGPGAYWSLGNPQVGFAWAKTTATATAKDNIPIRLYYGTDFTGAGDEDAVAVIPVLADGAKISINEFFPAFRLNGVWTIHVPEYLTYVP